MSEQRKKGEPAGESGRLSNHNVQALFVDHTLHEIAYDGQFEHLVVVSLIHEENPNREDGETENRKHD